MLRVDAVEIERLESLESEEYLEIVKLYDAPNRQDPQLLGFLHLAILLELEAVLLGPEALRERRSVEAKGYVAEVWQLLHLVDVRVVCASFSHAREVVEVWLIDGGDGGVEKRKVGAGPELTEEIAVRQALDDEGEFGDLGKHHVLPVCGVRHCHTGVALQEAGLVERSRARLDALTFLGYIHHGHGDGVIWEL